MRLAEFINRERAYDQTPAVAKADAKRDALWNALYYAWHYLMQLDPSHRLYQEAVKLRSEMTPYKGVWKHELSKETSELKGLRRDLEKQQCSNALQVLGLEKIAQALFAANVEVENAIMNRDTERGSRIADKGGDTTASLRKAVVNLLIDAYRQVNAAARINPGSATESAIKDVNGVIAQLQGRRRAAREAQWRRRAGAGTRPGGSRLVIGRRQIVRQCRAASETTFESSEVANLPARRFPAVRKRPLRQRDGFRRLENSQSLDGNVFEAFENAQSASGKTIERLESL